jgi:hypothetical protein
MNRRIPAMVLAGIGASLVTGLSPLVQAQTITNYTGVVQVTLNITIGALTPVPQGDNVVCTATITVSDPLGGTYSDSDTELANVSSSTFGSCTLTMPYLWQLGTGLQDKVTVSYTVVVAPSGNTGGPVTRSASGFDVASFSVPANGTTKALTFPTKI